MITDVNEMPDASFERASSKSGAESAPTRRGRGNYLVVWGLRAVIVAVIILGWQYVPDIPGIRRVASFEDPFFISSPTLVAHELYNLATGAQGATQIWGPLGRTVLTALVGSGVALVAGSVAGLAVSNWATLERVVRPFLVVANAVPKVAIIPIIVLLVGGSTESDALTALTVVFFIVFYNAAEGASTVPLEIIQSATLMGASKSRIMWQVRWPYALGWTFASLPNAIAFGLTASVTAEIFTGGAGLGYQLVLGIDNSNATLLFAIVVVVAIVGVVLVLSAAWFRRILLPWWENSSF